MVFSRRKLLLSCLYLCCQSERRIDDENFELESEEDGGVVSPPIYVKARAESRATSLGVHDEVKLVDGVVDNAVEKTENSLEKYPNRHDSGTHGRFDAKFNAKPYCQTKDLKCSKPKKRKCYMVSVATIAESVCPRCPHWVCQGCPILMCGVAPSLNCAEVPGVIGIDNCPTCSSWRCQRDDDILDENAVDEVEKKQKSKRSLSSGHRRSVMMKRKPNRLRSIRRNSPDALRQVLPAAGRADVDDEINDGAVNAEDEESILLSDMRNRQSRQRSGRGRRGRIGRSRGRRDRVQLLSEHPISKAAQLAAERAQHLDS